MPRYILRGHTPVAADDTLEWATFFGNIDRRRVAETYVTPEVHVSTVFLGIDHNYSPTGPPLLFETMIFGLRGRGEYQWRYATWEDAEVGHALAVQLAREEVRLLEPLPEPEAKAEFCAPPEPEPLPEPEPPGPKTAWARIMSDD